ncbi:MAG: hypothetical protein ACRDF0_08090 [Candidatus Limnocylindria bacterium]
MSREYLVSLSALFRWSATSAKETAHALPVPVAPAPPIEHRLDAVERDLERADAHRPILPPDLRAHARAVRLSPAM